jgi:hypothetical protein
VKWKLKELGYWEVQEESSMSHSLAFFIQVLSVLFSGRILEFMTKNVCGGGATVVHSAESPVVSSSER